MNKSLLPLASVLIVIVILGQWAAYKFPAEVPFAFPLMLILCGIITFFGIMALPGGSTPNGNITESRLRLSIAGTLVVIYVVFFGTVVFWKEGISELEKEMISTLTTLLAVVLPFYFGASAAVDISTRRDKMNSTEQVSETKK